MIYDNSFNEIIDYPPPPPRHATGPSPVRYCRSSRYCIVTSESLQVVTLLDRHQWVIAGRHASCIVTSEALKVVMLIYRHPVRHCRSPRCLIVIQWGIKCRHANVSSSSDALQVVSLLRRHKWGIDAMKIVTRHWGLPCMLRHWTLKLESRHDAFYVGTEVTQKCNIKATTANLASLVIPM